MFEQMEESNRLNSLPQRMLTAWKAIAYVLCFVVGLGFAPMYGAVSGLLWGKTIREAEAPRGPHSAKLLKKFNLADINFIMTVDGERVFRSGDLMGLSDGSYRETLMWDETGRVVVLELMGKRVFAYDTVEKRPLRKGELSQYKLFPSAQQPGNYYYAEIRDIDE